MNNKNLFFKIVFLILLSLSTKNINCMRETIYISANELCDTIIKKIERRYPSLIINQNTINIIWQKTLEFASKIRMDDSRLMMVSLSNFAQEYFIPLNKETEKFITNIYEETRPLSPEEVKRMHRLGSPKPKRSHKLIQN